MIIWRDPISRILANDAAWIATDPENVDKCNTDNYGLRWFVGKKFEQELTSDDVLVAKKRLDMFDIVLIVENLTETSRMLCRDLGWTECYVTQHAHPKPVDVLPASLFQKWMHRNRFELEVYKYAVEKANSMM